MSQGNLKDHY